MKPSGEVIAFIMTALLVVLSFMFAYKRQFPLSAIIAVLAFISFILGEVFGIGILSLHFNLSIEQIVCWIFGGCFFSFAVYLLSKKEVAYSFTVFLISVVTCFFGLAGVQGLLKTHLLMQVTNSLRTYGEKIDAYQTNVTYMEQDLLNQQGVLSNNLYSLEKSASSMFLVGKAAEIVFSGGAYDTGKDVSADIGAG